MSDMALNSAQIFSHKKTGVMYKYLGGNEYENMTTKKRGILSKEDVEKFLNKEEKISQLAADHPAIFDLIYRLSLVKSQ